MSPAPASSRSLHLVTDSPPELRALIQRAAQGDRRAQAELFRQHVQFVGHVARAAGAARELEDVVQDTFLEAFAGLARLSDGDALRPWLARLAVRQVHRRTRWRPWLSLFSGARDEADAWETMVDDAAPADVRAGVREVQRALEKTTPSARLCWLLRHWHGLTLEETAVATHLSLATVKRRLQLAEDALVSLRKEAAR